MTKHYIQPCNTMQTFYKHIHITMFNELETGYIICKSIYACLCVYILHRDRATARKLECLQDSRVFFLRGHLECLSKTTFKGVF